MKDLPVRDASVFDFGTGTGILAILAAMMGARRVVAIDNDEWSIRNATENAEKNNCSSIEILLSEELPTEKFDVILANINRNVILAQMRNLVNMMHSKSHLLVSGLMLEDEKIIVEACNTSGLQLIKRDWRGNWISLLVITGN
jgi:ribosomal protein L11 methyltransferase